MTTPRGDAVVDRVALGVLATYYVILYVIGGWPALAAVLLATAAGCGLWFAMPRDWPWWLASLPAGLLGIALLELWQ
jgi:hypothetical protein